MNHIFQFQKENPEFEKLSLKKGGNVIEEDILQDFLNENLEGIILLDKNRKIIKYNTQFLDYFDIIENDLNNSKFLRIFFENLNLNSKIHSNSLSKKEEFIEEFDLKKKNGQIIPIWQKTIIKYDNKGDFFRAIIFFKNNTEKRQLESEQLRAENMKSISFLAGGIAHDLNNIFTSILGNISIAKLEIEDDSNFFDILNDAENATIQAGKLTQQLLSFAKGGAPIKSETSLEELISETAKFSLRGTKVFCLFDFEANLWKIEADKGQLSQVFNNLIINAVQAIPNEGKITFIVNNIEVELNNILGLKNGKYVKIEIIDTGIGISQKNLVQLFTPYFTTKKYGNGLGLATSYNIIHRHGGNITVNSEMNIGTTFTIYLPAKIDI